MKVKKLLKIDVSRYHATHPGVVWLINNGYRPRSDGSRVYLVAECL